MRTLTCVAVGALAMTAAASADQVDLVYTGAGAGQWVTVVSPGYNGDLYAGQINVNIANSGGWNLDGNWIVFCSDLYQTVYDNYSKYQVMALQDIPLSDPMGIVKANAIRDMYTAAAGFQYTNDNDFAAAFQLAIWEIVYDFNGGIKTLADIYGGAFQATAIGGGALNGGMSAALTFLFASIGNTNQSAQLLGLGSEFWQDQIIEVPGPGALSIGALSVLMAGRRRRRA